ncbi:hypothetical protein ILUMI_02940 [Ignelater luminosus]|uniref:DUF8040 domain-containing protein n=1 Tax=Ignelater luminosus TaxID=2038154 RepID=A0A8K0DFJ0_IGNLU|nr:hypothetical protein ILUMI_02940 [Ignelater luminosus]
MSSSDSEEDTVMLYYMWKKKCYQKRNVWVRELFLNRNDNGEYWKLHNILLRDPMKFRNYYRMTEHCFNKLYEYVKPLFHAGHTNYRKTISFEERLAVTLRYLATGESFSSASYRFCISHNEIDRILKRFNIMTVMLTNPQREQDISENVL